METSIEQPTADVRDYLAEERTFLAWIRTGMTLMGFGFVVARFGLFLQVMQITHGGSAAWYHGLSPWSESR
jgi:putative membrane protein